MQKIRKIQLIDLLLNFCETPFCHKNQEGLYILIITRALCWYVLTLKSWEIFDLTRKLCKETLQHFKIVTSKDPHDNCKVCIPWWQAFKQLIFGRIWAIFKLFQALVTPWRWGNEIWCNFLKSGMQSRFRKSNWF